MKVSQPTVNWFCCMIDYFTESYTVELVDLSQKIGERIYTQIIVTKVLEIKIDVFEYHGKWLEGNPFQSHNIWMMQVVEKLNIFIEKLFLFLIKDLQHFLDKNSLTFRVSWTLVLDRVYISKGTLSYSPFHWQFATFRAWDVFTNLLSGDLFRNSWGSLKLRNIDIAEVSGLLYMWHKFRATFTFLRVYVCLTCDSRPSSGSMQAIVLSHQHWSTLHVSFVMSFKTQNCLTQISEQVDARQNKGKCILGTRSFVVHFRHAIRCQQREYAAKLYSTTKCPDHFIDGDIRSKLTLRHIQICAIIA